MPDDDFAGHPNPDRATAARRTWIGVGVALSVSLVIGGWFVFFASDDGDVTAAPSTTVAEETIPTIATTTSTPEEQSSTSEAETTTTTVLVPLTAPDQPPWTQVVDDALAGDLWEELRGVAHDGARLVAVGQSDRFVPAAWTSVDGLDWSLAASGGAFGRQVETLYLNDVVAAGPGFVAVGSDRSGDDADAAVWTSVDGSSWTRRARADLTLSLDQTMHGTTVLGSTIIAVGVESDGAVGEAAIWLSEDGLSWSRVPFAEAESGWREMRDVAVLPDGGVVAIGITGGEDEPQDGTKFAVWLSDDGVRWERQPSSALAVGGNAARLIRGVAAAPHGLRAFGVTWFDVAGSSDGATWISDDGLTWLAASWDDPALGGPGDQTMADGVLTADRWVAVGGETPDHIHPAAAVWILHLE